MALDRAQYMLGILTSYKSTVDQLHKELAEFVEAERESYEPMKVAMNAVASATLAAEAYRQELIINKLQQAVLNALKTENARSIEACVALAKDQARAQNQFQEAVANLKVLEASNTASNEKKHKAARAKMEAERRKKNTDEAFSLYVKWFEEHRLEHLRALLDQVVCAQLSYHCKMVEELEAAASHVYHIDPKAGARVLESVLNQHA